MARPIGTFEVPTNFETKIKWTLDARQLVHSYDDLLASFDQFNYVPLGFVVAVYDLDITKRGLYMCINDTALNLPSSWEKIGGGTTAAGNIYLNVSTDGSIAFPAKSILHNILLIPTNPSILHLGTSDGGDELYPDGIFVSGHENVVLNQYFPDATTIYISGIDSPTQIVVSYQDLGTLIT